MLKTTLAGLAAHKLRLLLTGIAITLGVGFIAGTFVLTDTMQNGIDTRFARSADKVDAAVVAKKGAAQGEIPVDLLGRIRALPGVTDAQGMVRGDAALVGKDGKVVGDFSTVGLSVPSGRLLRYDFKQGKAPAGPGEAVVDDKTAKRQGFKVGDTVTVFDQKVRPHRFRLSGIADFGIDQDAGYRGAVGFDPATALAMTGQKTYEEIDVAGGGLGEITKVAGGGFDVVTGKQLGERLAKSAGADMQVIRTGLLLFGLVSLLVSALVIYNTFTILIAQRMREMALLRCVGATRRQIFNGVLAESVVVGIVGSLLGLVVGAGLGGGALVLINWLGADMPSEGLAFAPRTAVIGMVVGVLVTVVSALLPARAATRVAPIAALRADLEPGSGRFRLGWARTTLTVLLGGLGVLAALYGSLGMEKGETAMYLVALSGGLIFLAVIALMPALVRPLGGLAGVIPARLGGVPGRLAVENARRSPRRTATTTIALTIGVGLMSLFAVVAASGKATSSAQLEKQFPVDFQLETHVGDEQKPVPGALVGELRKLPQLSAVTIMREQEVRVGDSDSHVGSVTQSSLGTVVKPQFKGGSVADLRPGTVAADENVAKSRGMRVGQTVRVATPHGAVPLKLVATVSGDTPLPTFLMTESDFTRYFGAKDPEAVYLNAKDGQSDQARAAIENATKPYPAIKLTSAADIKAQYTKALDMVLMIFGGLLGLAIIIALFGIANTLTLSVVERTRESALLRALGITKRQLRRMLSVEALVMAVIGAFTGVALGVVFGWAITNAMSKTSVFSLPYLQIVGFMVLAGAAGMAAAVLPARRAAKASIVESLASD